MLGRHSRCVASVVPQGSVPCLWRAPAKPAASRRTRLIRVFAQALEKSCIIWELDGGVVDLHMDAHRVAFNHSFNNFGYDCISFTVPLYNDLLSAGDGTAEGLIKAYFGIMGWPGMLATSDRPLFVKKVVEMKEKELLKLFQTDKVPLRESVDKVIADALAAGAKVVFITGTLSETADDVTSTVMRQLGPEVSSKIRVFHCNRTAGEESLANEDGPSSLSMSQMIQAETNKTKATAATTFAQMLTDTKLSDSALVIDIDNNLLASGNRRTITPELLSAISATVDVPLARCVLVGASSSVTSAAVQAGVTAVAVPRRMALQGSYPGVRAKLEGYGVGLLNWPRLNAFLEAGPGTAHQQ